MSEEMEKTPVVRAENAPVVKESQLPAEKKAAEVPAVARAKEAAHVDSPEADVEIRIIDNRDEEAESLIRWAAGRAGVIVAAPVLGTVALVANEVYMIAKVAKVYDVEVNQTAILSFIGSLGGTVIGTTLATLIPISIMQIPIGVTVTYGVGKAAQRWIKDGMPDDTRPYRAVFEEEKALAASEEKELEENPKKDEPLGDEKRDFTKELKKNWEDVYPEKAHAKMNELADQLSESVTVLGDKFLSALKKVGVTDEQIEKAKYTALGASEIAQETAEKAAKDLQAIARIKSREFKKDAAKKAEDVKAQAKDQMEVLQQQRELAILFVCHALALVQSLSHRIMVMYLGVVEESLPSSCLANGALHPYAKALLESVFSLHDNHERPIVPLCGEVPSPIDRPAGCPFHTRCSHCTELCRTRMPQMTAVGPEHWVACHRYSD